MRPLDLTSAYGALANEGYRVPPRMILEVRDPSGAIVYKAPDPTAPRTISAEAAYLVTDILAGNTDPKQNPIWSAALEIRNGPNGEHRPVAVKTGTANDARDLATYGYLAPPADPKAPGLVVGIWMGNSDHSMPQSSKPATSLTAAAPLWRAFVRDITAGTPIADFPRPGGVISATIDKWSGGRPSGWTHGTIKEYFIDGTQPGARHAVDPDGLLYSHACGGWRVDPLKAELGPREWDADVANWLYRARRGVGRRRPARQPDGLLLGRAVVGRLTHRGVRQAEAGARAAEGEATQGEAAEAGPPASPAQASRSPDVTGLAAWIGRGAALAVGVGARRGRPRPRVGRRTGARPHVRRGDPGRRASSRSSAWLRGHLPDRPWGRDPARLRRLPPERHRDRDRHPAVSDRPVPEHAGITAALLRRARDMGRRSPARGARAELDRGHRCGGADLPSGAPSSRTGRSSSRSA